MKKSFWGFGLSLLLATSTHVIAQEQKEIAIFLGDTLKINSSEFSNLVRDTKELLQPIQGNENYYIAKATGHLVVNNTKYRIYNQLQDGVTKVLVIGNSFSDDGVEWYLHEMARSTGKPLVIGNLFRGGAPLDFHLKNAQENKKIYSYRKTTIDGIKSNTDKTSILEALKDENWDYICFQQASVSSGNWGSVEEFLPPLFSYVKANYPVSAVKYLYHQTWAYGQNAVTANFEKYNRDQQFMYGQIVDVSRKVKDLIPVYKIIPSGTAIQNGRTSYVADNFTREAYHLDLVLGRYTAASTWYQTLFSDLDKVTYKPTYLSEEQAKLGREAAIKAVSKPFEVTKLSSFERQDKKYIDFERIKINFGSDIVIAGWLSLLYEKEESARYAILDETNIPTSINIKVLKSFDTRKGGGPKKVSFESGVPAQVSQSYFETKIYKENANVPYLRIENLHPGKSYELRLISTVAANQAETIFNVQANKEYKAGINPSYNRHQEVRLQLKPTKEGEISIAFDLPNGEREVLAVINALILKQLK